MSYIALQTVTYTGADGRPCAAAPGQEIPEFAGWAASVRRALLNLGRVVDTEAKCGRVLSTAGGQLRLVPYSQAARPVAGPPGPAQAQAEDQATHAPPGHVCATCSQTFATARGLKKHGTQAHRRG